MLKLLTDYIGFITAIVGFLTLWALFYAPIMALRIQKKIETFKEDRERKFNVFKTLLSTRGNTVSMEHVQALNTIDIEFYGNNAVEGTWNVYRDHLNSYPYGQDKATQDRWEDKRLDYITDLLYSMANFFQYNFDKVTLRKGAYSPLAHGVLNQENALIRKGVIEVLDGGKPIKIKLSEG